MSDATEPSTEPDAWARACADDLAAERARRRERYGRPPRDPVADLRRLSDAVTGQLGRFGLDAAPLADRVRSSVEPALERNADVVDHLARAGEEFVAAFRAAVADRGASDERRDSATDHPSHPGDLD